MVVLVRSLEQLRALQESGEGATNSIGADFARPKDLNEAVAIGRGFRAEGIWLTSPRITRTGKRWMLATLMKVKAFRYREHNADQLELLTALALETSG